MLRVAGAMYAVGPWFPSITLKASDVEVEVSMPDRIQWNCPLCKRAYLVRSLVGLTICPTCQQNHLEVTPSTIPTPPTIPTPRPDGRSTSRSRRTVPMSVFLMTLGVSVIVSFLLGRSVAPRTPNAPAQVPRNAPGLRPEIVQQPQIVQPRQIVQPPQVVPAAAPAPGRIVPVADHDIAVQMLNENLDDGDWKEVKWWPAVDQSKELEALTASIKNEPNAAPVDKRNKWWLDESVKLYGNNPKERGNMFRGEPKRVARMRFRAKTPNGGSKIQDVFFVFYETKVRLFFAAFGQISGPGQRPWGKGDFAPVILDTTFHELEVPSY